MFEFDILDALTLSQVLGYYMTELDREAASSDIFYWPKKKQN